jgi:ATP-dependent RNA helicase DeaD
MKFNELGLKDEIIQAISDLGFENPTPIQQEVIPQILNEPADLVGLAQTGTGKTAAFGLPMVHLVDFTERDTQGIIICPTRELALQITRDLQDFTKYLKGSNVTAVYGGASIETQIKSIRRGSQIIVATPGRLVDLIERRAVNLATIQYVVLDEADEMLNMGFKEDLDFILKQTPETKVTWLFSATMPREVASIAKNYMSNPLEVTIGTKNQSAANIEHMYYVVKEKDRYAALKRVLDYNPDIFGLVFCRTRRETQYVADHLIKDGYNSAALHGDLSQAQRDSVMQGFRSRSLQILVATDVAARGIDVDNVTHVINYNLPDEIESYTHRSGRTARAGRSGISIVLINTRETRKISEMERLISKKFTQGKVPSGYAVCEKQLFSLVNKMVQVKVNEDEIGPFLESIYGILGGYSKEELIQRFVSAEFNRFLDYYRGAEDLNAARGDDSRGDRGERGERSERGDRGERAPRGEYQRFFINVGRLDKINAGAIVRLVCNATGINSKALGRVDLNREFSFFEVEKAMADKVLPGLKGAELDGRVIRVEKTEEGGGGSSRGGGSPRDEKPFGGRGKGGFKRGGESSSFGKDKFRGDRDGGRREGKKKHRKG